MSPWSPIEKAWSDRMARIPDNGMDRVIEAAEECPGGCIFIEVE